MDLYRYYFNSVLVLRPATIPRASGAG
jgi:hypothetical protein